MDAVAQVWHRALATQDRPPVAVMLATAAIALLLVLYRPAWGVSRHVVTIVHEAAHGVAALLAGRRLGGIRLHSDTSGLTVSRGKPRGAGMVLTFLAGYPGPALFGLAAAAVLGGGHAVGLLWAALAGLALLLLQIRNWFGLYSVLVSGAAVFAVSWWPDEQWQSACAYLITWFLLLAAPRPVLELQAKRRAGGARDSDADRLARLTGLPGLVWVGVFAVLSFGALAVGGYWLTSPYR
jgi:hypothetical protein